MSDVPRIRDHEPDHHRSADRCYADGARRIAAAVLAVHPTAHAVAFDTYVDDDTMDCGPVLDAAGRTLLSDVSDLADGLDIERIVAGWSSEDFLAAGGPCVGTCPVTGRPLLLLAAVSATGGRQPVAA